MKRKPMTGEYETTDHEDVKEEWDIWKERAFIEALANQRLNFLLVFTPVVIAGSEAAKSHLIKCTVSVFGFFIAWMMATIAKRTFLRLHSLIGTIETQNPSHEVVTHWEKKCQPNFRYLLCDVCPGIKSNLILGGCIPLICVSLLCLLAIVRIVNAYSYYCFQITVDP